MEYWKLKGVSSARVEESLGLSALVEATFFVLHVNRIPLIVTNSRAGRTPQQYEDRKEQKATKTAARIHRKNDQAKVEQKTTEARVAYP